MKYSFFYSLKVWLSSTFLAPLIYILAECAFSHNRSYPDSFTDLYPIFVLFELLFSFITWLVFLLVVELAGMLYYDIRRRKTLLSIAGVALTIGTFFIFSFQPKWFCFTDLFFDLMICNCLSIAAACWVFRLGPKSDHEENNSNYEFPQNAL